MCTEFLWLLEIKPSYQAKHIHVYIWPTLSGSTVINLWNYNLKHNEVSLLEKILQLLNEVKAAGPHWSVPPPFLASIKVLWAKGSPSVHATTIPCRDRAVYFHTGRWIFKGEPGLALCPELLAADKQSGFTSGPLSLELTLYPQKAPWSREPVPFIMMTEKALMIVLTMGLVHTVLFKHIFCGKNKIVSFPSISF